MLNWLFRNRKTGEITIAQAPNVALWVFIAAWLGTFVFDPLRWVARGALGVWAVDEIVRGVNPWRRILGAGVLTAMIVGLVRG